MSDHEVTTVWTVNYTFDPGNQTGVRREWKRGKLVSERPTTLDEALPRELHPTVREILGKDSE